MLCARTAGTCDGGVDRTVRILRQLYELWYSRRQTNFTFYFRSRWQNGGGSYFSAFVDLSLMGMTRGSKERAALSDEKVLFSSARKKKRYLVLKVVHVSKGY